MEAKLTLKLDKGVIEKAKSYAASQKRSLSKLIETYLKSLASTTEPNVGEEIQISPFVRSLSSGVNIPSDIDYQKQYKDHLSEKHK